jgi:DNA-binding transcriptional LysR family regulator
LDRRLIKDLDILTLQLFVAICEEGTLTRAAQREAIAPSAVSKRLADLEAAFATELFFRRASGMVPTSAGATMLHHSRSMLQNFESIGIELKEYAQGIRGYVRLRANISALVQFLPEDLRNFLAVHPEIKLDLVERPSRAIVEEIETGAADLGIVSTDVATPDLTTSLYRRDRLVLAVAPSHALAARDEIAFDETLGFDHVGLHADSSVISRSLTAARHAGMPLRLKVHVPSFDALCRMVQADLGISILPDRAFEVIGRPLGLHALRLTDDWAARELRLVHRGKRTLSAAGRLLLAHLSAVEAPR